MQNSVYLLSTVLIVVVWNVNGQYHYPVPPPQYQLTYPTRPVYTVPEKVPEERVTPAPRIEVPTLTTPEPQIVERIVYIPDDHLEADDEKDRKIRDQDALLQDQDKRIGNLEQDGKDKEAKLNDQLETIRTLEEEIRRLRGKPDLGAALGDKIIELVEEQKRQAAEQGNQGQEEEIIRRTQEERTTTTVGGGAEDNRAGVEGSRGSSFRQSSSFSSSSSSSSRGSGSSGNTGNLDGLTDEELAAGRRTGASRSSSFMSSSSRSSSSRGSGSSTSQSRLDPVFASGSSRAGSGSSRFKDDRDRDRNSARDRKKNFDHLSNFRERDYNSRVTSASNKDKSFVLQERGSNAKDSKIADRERDRDFRNRDFRDRDNDRFGSSSSRSSFYSNSRQSSESNNNNRKSLFDPDSEFDRRFRELDKKASELRSVVDFDTGPFEYRRQETFTRKKIGDNFPTTSTASFKKTDDNNKSSLRTRSDPDEPSDDESDENIDDDPGLRGKDSSTLLPGGTFAAASTHALKILTPPPAKGNSKTLKPSALRSRTLRHNPNPNSNTKKSPEEFISELLGSSPTNQFPHLVRTSETTYFNRAVGSKAAVGSLFRSPAGQVASRTDSKHAGTRSSLCRKLPSGVQTCTPV